MIKFNEWLDALDAETLELIQNAAAEVEVDAEELLRIAYARSPLAAADGEANYAVGVFGISPNELEANGFQRFSIEDAVIVAAQKLKKATEDYPTDAKKRLESFTTAEEANINAEADTQLSTETITSIPVVDATPTINGEAANSSGFQRTQQQADVSDVPVQPDVIDTTDQERQRDAAQNRLNAAAKEAQAVIQRARGIGQRNADALQTSQPDVQDVADTKTEINNTANAQSNAIIQDARQRLSAIDQERLRLAEQIIGNSDPLNPDSALATGRQRAEELGRRLPATSRAAEYVADATLFSNPAAFIERAFFGNRYASGSRELSGLIRDQTQSNRNISADLQSQINLASNRLPNRADVTFETNTELSNLNTQTSRDIQTADFGIQAQQRRAAALQTDTALRQSDVNLENQNVRAVQEQVNSARQILQDTRQDNESRTLGAQNPQVVLARAAQVRNQLAQAQEAEAVRSDPNYIPAAAIDQLEVQTKAQELQALANVNTPEAVQRRTQLQREIQDINLVNQRFDAQVQREVRTNTGQQTLVDTQVATNRQQALTAEFETENFTRKRNLSERQLQLEITRTNNALSAAPEQQQLTIQELETGNDVKRREAQERKAAIAGWQKAGKEGPIPNTILDDPRQRTVYAQFNEGEPVGANIAEHTVRLLAAGIDPTTREESQMVSDLQIQIGKLTGTAFTADLRYAATAKGLPQSLLLKQLDKAKPAGRSGEASLFGGSRAYNLVTIGATLEYGRENGRFSDRTLELIEGAGEQLNTAVTPRQLVEILTRQQGSVTGGNIVTDALATAPGAETIRRLTYTDNADITVALREILSTSVDATNNLKRYGRWGLPELEGDDLILEIDTLGFDTKVDLTTPAAAQVLLREYTQGFYAPKETN